MTQMEICAEMKRGERCMPKMDATVYPAVPCEFDVHADKLLHATYYEYDAEGNPLRIDDALVPAYLDENVLYASSAKPVPLHQ